MKYRVLIVDDDFGICSFLSSALKDEEFEVEVANNGLEALTLLRQNSPDYYNLILLDMQMPVLDGWKFLSIYHQEQDQQASIPIIVMTAAMTIARYASNISADGFLAKPFDLEGLFTLVNKFLPAEVEKKRYA